MAYSSNGNGNIAKKTQMQFPASETTDICDANSPLLETGELRVLTQGFVAFGGRRAFSGQVVTVKSFEDNAVVIETLFENKQRKPNVLVVDAGGSLRRSMVGSVFAQLAHDMGWAGIVVNGCVRDVDEMNSIDIGVRALGCIPVRSFKKGGGEKRVTVQFAGAIIRNGDWLYADNNGILVSNAELSVLGPVHRPILEFNYYAHTIADYTSPVEPYRLFQAHCLDDHNFLPKFLPRHSFQSIEFLLGDSTAVGCVKLHKFPQGNIFKYVKNRVDEIDIDQLFIKYSSIEGDILGDKWDRIEYEIKIEPSTTGSHFKMIGHYHAKQGVVPTEDDVIFTQEGIKNMHKVVQEVLLVYPHLYAVAN